MAAGGWQVRIFKEMCTCQDNHELALQMVADGHCESWHQMCIPQPAWCLHEDDLLQTLDREGDWHQVLKTIENDRVDSSPSVIQ